jgi:starch synthase
MKVIHLIKTLLAGGAELHLLTLAKHQRALGADVRVAYLKDVTDFGSRPLRPDFEAAGIPTINLQTEARGLRTFVKQEKPDILHTHLPRADLAGAFARAPRRVVSAHDVYSGTQWSGKWAMPVFTMAWKRADAVIAISHAVRDWLVSDRGLDPAKITVIHYGLEAERFESGRDLRPEWGIRGPIVGTIGRLEPRKGHETLIRAMKDVEATLVIAGHDPWGHSKELLRLTDELGLRDRVRLVGFQSDVPSFLHSIDVFAFASRSEGFGQVVIEAMAAGRPVVASRIAPLTEIVVDGETGRLVEADGFAAAIRETLASPGAMGERGRERVRSHFSAARMAERTLELYRGLVQARGGN